MPQPAQTMEVWLILPVLWQVAALTLSMPIKGGRSDGAGRNALVNTAVKLRETTNPTCVRSDG